ncbi:MAG: plasmid pRiA4b ORF-3 family protein [Bacteroidaceae bacterium]|jgi:hypothetical protein|nr:plasmid pRiA4b ORF-3 family protein [Bacteroidaceae bacterium]
MVYRFTIISDEVENFMREIKIDADAKFIELHKLILDSCGYKDDQMTSFTICEDGWEKGQEITLEKMDTDSDSDSYVMAETELSEFLEDEKQHLLYTFDPLADRCFFIELSEIETGKSLDKGKVTRKIGDAPQQSIDFDDMLARNPIPASEGRDIDDDYYSEEGISDEDLDVEGLDITDGEPF